MGSSAADALMRRKLLEEMYDRMTDEERRLFVMMTMRERSAGEILEALAERRHLEQMQALREQRDQMERMERRLERQNWYTDFGSDVAVNLLTDGLVWLAHRLFSR